jgi:hypothetical protein
MGRGNIDPESVVLLVVIYDSNAGPYMASDNRYYIRAGAHTVKARHFIIDAIWAKRHFSKPRLAHVLKSSSIQRVVSLGIVALTDSPAIDVQINVLPLPKMLRESEHLFPLKIHIIDRNNPFFLDVGFLAGDLRIMFGDDISISLEVEYHDLGNNFYSCKTKIDILRSLPPVYL